jgi:hypothetical protein
MDFTGMIAKINLFRVFLLKFLRTFEAEKVPLFRKNLIRACRPIIASSHLCSSLDKVMVPQIHYSQ